MKKKIIILAALLLLGVSRAAFAQGTDTVTVTTYYPAPYGEYKELRLTPRDDVDPTASCSNEGAMYHDDSDNQIYFCDGKNWQPVGGGGGNIAKSGSFAINIDGGPNSDVNYKTYVDVRTGLNNVTGAIANGYWCHGSECYPAQISLVQLNSPNAGYIRILVNDIDFTDEHPHVINWLATGTGESGQSVTVNSHR